MPQDLHRGPVWEEEELVQGSGTPRTVQLCEGAALAAAPSLKSTSEVSPGEDKQRWD